MTVDQLYALWIERDARYAIHRKDRPPRPLSRAEVAQVREWRMDEALNVEDPGSGKAFAEARNWEPPTLVKRGRRSV